MSFEIDDNYNAQPLWDSVPYPFFYFVFFTVFAHDTHKAKKQLFNDPIENKTR